ncbi:P-loop containing nucleoside triphosphate hydrolase protein [Lasiosphaeris hirsuta]|uniref:P-loop containing nucleoside triphosphate hydrolase protein n=1 Tax=Lasiosphaeris hirsuta TaxID=260670 RepID=A0AA40E6I8_9PEZI|nr:P-loop containing nucleoside triphosphate hydrolase protein [Lasiosphaeris hirsuta]
MAELEEKLRPAVASAETTTTPNPKNGASRLSPILRVHWAYSTRLDHTLRVIGLVAAIGSGVLPPLMTVIFGASNALYLFYLFLGRFALVYIHSTCFGVAGIRIARAFRVDFIRAMVRQDVSFIDQCAPGTVSSTISNSADMVENGSTEKVGNLVQNVAMFVAAFVVAFVQQWKLTLAVATTVPVLVTAFVVTFGLDAKIEAEILNIYNNAAGLVEEALSSVRVVTAFNASGKLSRNADFFTIYCAYALAWFFGIKLLDNGEIGGGGQVITVLLAVFLGTNAASTIAPGFGDFVKASAAARAMFEVIDRKSEIDPLAETGERPAQFDGSIELRNVSFAYPSRPSVQVLGNFSLAFEAAKVRHCPTGGSIYVGGHDVAGLNLRGLRGRIGLVQQEPVLFRDTIYNNVVHGLYGTPVDDLPEHEKRELVRQACIQAFADDFIQELPQKYDTKVGDRGGLLSGGQKQRIAIARSVISNPQILLLDEATSALDPTAERKVQASLDNVTKSRTTIMIAHKLSTVQKADKIVEQGTHQQLLDRKGVYHELVNAQALHAGQGGIETGENSKSPSINDRSDEAAVENIDPALSKPATKQRPQAPDQDQDTSNGNFDEDKEISRKLSLARCLGVIVKEQRHVWPIFLLGTIASTAAGGLFPAQARGDFWALMYFVFSLGVLVCYLGVGFFWNIAAFHLTRFYRLEYFDAMLRQNISFFDTRGHGASEMTSRLSLHPQRLQNLISTNMALMILTLVNIFSCLLLAIAMGWKLGLVVVAGGMPILFGAGYYRLRVEMSNEDRLSQMYAESARFASEAIGAIRTVSSLTLENKVLDSFRARLEESSSRELRSKMAAMLRNAFADSLNLAVASLGFWYGGKLLSEGEYDTRTFFIVFMAVLMDPIRVASYVSQAHLAANHIISLRRARPLINTSTGLLSLPPHNPSTPAIEFRNVTFTYPSRPDHPALHDLSLTIPAGAFVGIVGASGSGKSTLMSLLLRFHDPTAGEILVTGTPLRALDIHAHRARLGLVSQETMLFAGPVRDNILLGLPDAQADAADVQERVEKACRAADIHEFIAGLPDRYATDVGNRGVGLSGGQRQRLAIARALVREPGLLLFDEATSALDSASEAGVLKAIEGDKKGRTTVSVAHRLSTVKRCDVIFVLERGRLVEMGGHDELVRRRGQYWEMVVAQAGESEVSMK